MINYIDGPEVRITENDGIFVNVEFYHTKEKYEIHCRMIAGESIPLHKNPHKTRKSSRKSGAYITQSDRAIKTARKYPPDSPQESCVRDPWFVFRLRTPFLYVSSQLAPMRSYGFLSVYGGLVPLGFSHSNQPIILQLYRQMPFE